MKEVYRYFKIKSELFDNSGVKNRIITIDNVQNKNTKPEAEIVVPTPLLNRKFDNNITSALAIYLLQFPRISRHDPFTNINLTFTKVCPQSKKLRILLTTNILVL